MKRYLKLLILIILSITLYGCGSTKVTIDYNCEGIEEYKCSVLDDKLNCIIIMPECKGYSFVGWYDAKASGNEVNLDADFKKDTTIYAIWEEDGSPKQTVEPPKEDDEPAEVTVVEKSYKVTFNLNGGSGNNPQDIEVKSDEMMPSIGNIIPTRNDYSFMGWYDNIDYTLGSRYYDESNEPVKYYDVKKNMTLYAGWKENKTEVSTPAEVTEEIYKVTFNLNGGNGYVPNAKEIKNNELMPDIGSMVPTRSGYTFTGWYDNKDYTKGKAYYDEKNKAVKYYDVKKNIALYAGWSKDLVVMSYKLIFNPNGGSGGQTDAVMVKKGESLPRITSTPPTKKGHTFVGWYDQLTGGTEYYNASGVSSVTYNKEENTTLYARWKANTYSITFNINGGTGSIPTSTNVTYGNMVPSITKTTPSRSGYTFVGWYDNSDYTQGKAYYSSKNESVLKYDKTSNTTLYAGWSKNAVSTYVVAFNSNGGSGGQTSSVSVSKGSEMPTISKTAPVRDGYTFNGWYDQLTGGNQYYTKDGNSARNYDKSSGCTLYAQYTAITYKISYTLNGGSASNVTSATYDNVITINNPTKTFTVSIDSNSTGATLSSTSSSSSQTFLGWTADSNLDTKNALYGSTTSTNNRWTSKTTKVKDIYFKNLMSVSGTVNLTANWSSVEVTLPTVTKSGYECGYSVSRTGSIAYSSGSRYKPSITTNNAILYAVCNKSAHSNSYAKVNYSNFKWFPYKLKSGPVKSYYKDIMPYAIWAPTDVSDLNGVSLPLIVWLHSAGEVTYADGMTIEKFVKVAFPKVISDWNNTGLDPIPAIIVAPQAGGTWKIEDDNKVRYIESIKALIEYTKDKYNIDTSNIVLMGHSMGGDGVIQISYSMLKKYNHDYFSKLVTMSATYNLKYPKNDLEFSHNYFSSKEIRGYAEKTYSKPFFDWIGKPENFRYMKDVKHSYVPKVAMKLDENNDGVSDLVYWLFGKNEM